MALNRLSATLRNPRFGVLFPSINKEIRTAAFPLAFRITPNLLAEPLKRKRKVDPVILRNREERRKKKIERQIRKLERCMKQLKPIEEVITPFQLLDQKQARTRKVTVSPQIAEERALIKKDWARDRLKTRLSDVQLLDHLVFSQQRALDELRQESEELYQAAVMVDSSFLPLTFKGPVETPPIENYPSPDGDYQDVSKKWQ